MSGFSSPRWSMRRGDVVGHEPEVDRPIDVGGPAVRLEVGRDDLVLLCQRREGRPEHLAGSEPAVEQDHRPPLAVDFVVQVKAVDVCVGACALHVGRHQCVLVSRGS